MHKQNQQMLKYLIAEDMVKKIGGGYRLKTDAEMEMEMYRDKGTGYDKYFQRVK